MKHISNTSNQVALNKNQLREHHRCLLEIATAVKIVCEKNGIKYFLVAGTLLGAVRHKGFIPWDDDFDIGMMRAEYDKFVKVAQRDLPSNMFLQIFETDIGMGLPIAKVRLHGTLCIEKVSAGVNWHQGIWVDVFPFDNVPAGAFAKAIHGLECYMLRRLLLCKLGYKCNANERKYIKYIIYIIIVYPLASIFSRDALCRLLNRVLRRYNNASADCVVACGGAYGYRKETISISWVDKLKPMEFEGRWFMCPHKHNEYLLNLYGDYLMLPPEGRRVSGHQIIKLEFGENIRTVKCVK